jgi:hypothetical protein
MRKEDMEEIVELVAKTIWLLNECDLSDRAEWFEDKREILRKGSEDEVINALNEIDKILAGIGSFSDLPLIPKKGSVLNKLEAREMQWNLVEQLGDKIAFHIKNA